MEIYGKAMIDAAHDPRKPLLRDPNYQELPRFSELSAGEPRCECGHGLYRHYMCGDPKESRCLTRCGCAQFKPASYKKDGG